MFAYIKHLLGVSNGLITKPKKFSPKAETHGRNKKTSERTDNLILRSVKNYSLLLLLKLKKS